jgi:hypothetical protein
MEPTRILHLWLMNFWEFTFSILTPYPFLLKLQERLKYLIGVTLMLRNILRSLMKLLELKVNSVESITISMIQTVANMLLRALRHNFQDTSSNLLTGTSLEIFQLQMLAEITISWTSILNLDSQSLVNGKLIGTNPTIFWLDIISSRTYKSQKTSY